MPSKSSSTFRRVQQSLARSRFLTFSVLLHIILVVMAGSVVFMRHTPETPDFPPVEVGPLVPDQLDDPTPPVSHDDQIFEPRTPAAIPPPINPISVSKDTTFKMPVASTRVKLLAAAKLVGDPTLAALRSSQAGPWNVPSVMSSRMTGTGRDSMMNDLGGKQASKEAVLAGLRWLKNHQNPDGSWSDEFKPSMTGLALLCFLGHGELQTSVEYGPTVQHGIDWMIAKGTEFDGRMALAKDGWGGNAGVYEHAISAYALGEYYSMTQDDRVKDVLSKAAKYIVDGQNEDGGWKYSYEKGGGSDTSVTGWQIQALKAAHLTGLQLPGVDDALDKCMLYLKSAQCPDGGFGYHGNTDEHYALGGVGTLCTYFWKQDKDKLVHQGIRYIVEKTKNGDPVVYKSPKADLYGWYYDTQACLMFGGSAWTQWNRWFQDEIVNAQNKADGSWPPMVNAGIGALQTKAEGAGPFYRTTLCVLMLEVYYRYMPVNK